MVSRSARASQTARSSGVATRTTSFILVQRMRRSLALMGSFALGAGLVEDLAMMRPLVAYGHLGHSQGMLGITLARGNPIPPSVDLSTVPTSRPVGVPSHLWAMWAFAT